MTRVSLEVGRGAMSSRPAALPAIICALALALMPAPLLAQSGNAGVLLELPASTRALALGNAYVAVGGDESALFYNPAQLATVPGISATLSVEQYLGASTLGALSAGVPVGFGSLAVGLQVLDYGSSEVVLPDPGDGSGLPTGATVTAGDYAISLGYGVRLGALRVGAAGKYISQRLASQTGSASAVDAGAALDVWRGATVAVALQNVGRDLEIAGSRGPLPRTVRVGAAIPVRVAKVVDVLGTVELSRVRAGSFTPAAGVEASWSSDGGLVLLGRAGVYAPPDRSAASPFTFGGGVRTGHIALDYAYQGYEALGATHRFGVRWWR